MVMGSIWEMGKGSLHKLLQRYYYILIVLSLFLGWFLIHTSLILADGFGDTDQQADVIVVLGNAIKDNGEPSDILKYRLEKAYQLYKDGRAKTIIVSGSIEDIGKSESKVMQHYLINKGVPKGAIIVDEFGINTLATAQNSYWIMKKHRWNSVIIVSQYHHITRCKLAFKFVGINNIYTAHAEFFEMADLRAICREFVGYYVYVVRNNFPNNSIV